MFRNSSLGLGISDGSIKLVELLKTGNGLRLGRFEERKIPSGVIEAGKIKEAAKMKEILSSVKKKSVHLSLPGELLNKEEEIVKEYISIFKNSMISTKSILLKAEAILKAVIKKGDPGTYMIVDFGKKHTGIFVVSHGTVIYSSVMEFGGEKLTEMLRKNFGMSFEEVEKIKRQYGFRRDASNVKMHGIFSNFFSTLEEEIKRHLVRWHLHKNGSLSPIKKIILCGEEASIKGLAEYLSVGLRSKVELLNVWTNILDTEKNIPEMSLEESFKFAPALGAALKGFG